MYCSQILLGGGVLSRPHIRISWQAQPISKLYIYLTELQILKFSQSLKKKSDNTCVCKSQKKKNLKKKKKIRLEWFFFFFWGGGDRGRGPDPSSGRPAAYDLFWFLLLDHIDERQKAKGDLFLFYLKHCFESKCIQKLKRKNKLGSHCTNDMH